MKSTSKVLVLLAILIVIGAILWKTLDPKDNIQGSVANPVTTPVQEVTTTSPQETTVASDQVATAPQQTTTQEISTSDTTATQETTSSPVDEPSQYQATITNTTGSNNSSGEFTCVLADKVVATLYEMRTTHQPLEQALNYLQNTASLPSQELEEFSRFAQKLWTVPVDQINVKEQIAIYHDQCLMLAKRQKEEFSDEQIIEETQGEN